MWLIDWRGKEVIRCHIYPTFVSFNSDVNEIDFIWQKIAALALLLFCAFHARILALVECFSFPNWCILISNIQSILYAFWELQIISSLKLVKDICEYGQETLQLWGFFLNASLDLRIFALEYIFIFYIYTTNYKIGEFSFF